MLPTEIAGLDRMVPEVSDPQDQPQLERGLGLSGAVSANVLNMVGVGPFLTIPLAIAAMGGPQAMVGWILGALLCLCDGMVWAELGSAMPGSGGSYHYLREAFGRDGFGLLMSFLFLWQTLLTGPFSIAAGAVGFSDYMGFIAPGLSHRILLMIAVGVCATNAALLYRNIRSIDRMAIAISIVVVATCCWVILTGALHFHSAHAFDFTPDAFHFSHSSFWYGLGAATLIAVYDYGGYNNVCLLGGEIRRPNRNIPIAVVFSIVLVGVLYLCMNLSIIGAMDWRTVQHSSAVAADFMQTLYGHRAALLISFLVLIISFGAVFANMLGYSRIPYAAAADGQFFRVFARLHPVGKFPAVSLLFMAFASTIACFFSLSQLIKVLIVVQALFQFAAQCVAVELLRRRRLLPGDSYRMPLYPLPAAIALLGWIYIAFSSGTRYVVIALATVAVGTSLYLIKAKMEGDWPFVPRVINTTP
jgi:amino acid transporter